MPIRRIAFYLFFAILVVLVIGIPIRSQYLETTAAGKPSILAGRNVNIGSGTKLPFGDPWLQRQNEPSIVASTRNPLHLFAGGNDYRTIDVPDQFELPGIQGAANAHDAWLGVYESFDGGQSWITTLLPGFPQDLSAEGQLSPINTYQTACDPIVRAGANGLFYYCGIAFDRNKNKSAVFVARYQDNNNLEKVEVKIDQDGQRKYFGPIQYIDTKLVATGSTSSSFIDMPNMAVDIPRKGTLYGNIFVAYTVFLNTSQNNTQDRIMFQKSTDGGVTWSTPPVQLSTTGQLVQRPVIAVDPIDLTGKTIYVAFRRFAGGGASNGIVVVRSTDGGMTFSKLPDVVSSFDPFDQGTSNTSFRTNSYPTMAVGDLGTVYLAWSQRQGGPSGQARIMISAFKKGGLVWSTPKIVDQNYAGIGHQFMPSLTFASWKLMLAWYDQRGDKELEESPYIEDSPVKGRHTIDVRAAEGTPGVPPSFSPSIQVSRYLYVLNLDANGNPQTDANGYQKVIQAESNYINYPLFQQGTVPFHGDYLEITASSKILPPAVAFGFWIYNINPLEPTSFHAAWTDNRDVRPPGGDTWGNWANYSAPNSVQDPGWGGPGCSNGANTGMRNQNIYTANINNGIVMGSPGNTKQLDLPLSGEGGRAFVVFVRNTTASEKALKLVIMQIGGVRASFDQFINDDSIQVKVQPYSSVSTTVYVDRSSRKLAPVKVIAFEGLKLVGYVVLNPDPTNLPLSDPDNPFQSLGNETHNPTVSDPKVWNYDLGSPDEPNPSALLNPRGQNESVVNNELANPRGQNTGVLNPRGQNESIVNYEVANPRGQNVGVENSALTDVTWNVTNDGNTTSAYTFNIRSNAPDNFNGSNPPLIAQVLVYKLHKVPIDKDCQLYEMRQDELIVNITKPQVQNPRGQNNPPTSTSLSSQDFSMSTQASDLSAQDVTFNLAPGEQADVIFRVWDENTADGSPTFTPNMVASEVVAEAVNTDDVERGITTPSYDAPPNSEPWVTPSPEISALPATLSFLVSLGGGTPAPQNLEVWDSGGGNLSYIIEDDVNWLSVYPDSGTSSGGHNSHSVSVSTTGLAVGTYSGTITIRDPLASNNPLKIPVTLTIYSGGISGSEWTNRWGPAGHSYQAVATAVDAVGNTYVTGIMSTIGGETRSTDYCTIKIDSLGQFVWDRYFDRGVQDRPSGIVVDSAGNIIVTGSSTDIKYETGYDYATIKYNGNGDALWLQFYDGAASSDDYAKAIAVDAAGNIYVTGSTTNGNGNTDYATIKYGAANGEPVWTTLLDSAAIYNGLGNANDDPVALDVDSSGNLYVTGSSDYGSSGGFINYATIKYDGSNGNPLWAGAAIYDGREHGEDIPRAMAVDLSGNVVVTGSSNFGSGGGLNYATIKYNTDGNTVWEGPAIFAGDQYAGEDVPVAIAVDSAGDVYVTGYSERERKVNNNEFFDYDYTTIKYLGADGSESWVAEYAGPGGQYVGPGGDDWPVAMVVDSSKNVYVTGYSIGDLQDEDYATAMYDRNGNELWVRRYTNGGMDRPSSIALDLSGNAYVAGTSEDENTQFCTIKYNPDLVEWSDIYDGSAGLIDWASDVVTDSSGNVYVTGVSTETGTGTDFVTLKLDNAGHRLWLARYDGPVSGDDSGKSIAVDSSGNVYVTGTSTQATTGEDITTIKYDRDGDLVWMKSYSSTGANTDTAAAIGLDPSGHVLVSGSAGGEIVTIQYDSAGNVQWARTYVGPYPDGDACHDMAVSPSGNICVTGQSYTPETMNDIITIKYDSLGNELWAKSYDGPVSRGEWGIAVAVDAAESVYVAGYGTVALTGGMHTTTIKYDSGGNQQWATINDSAVRVSTITLDSSGYVYVAGEVITKYDNGGNIVWVSGSYNDTFAAMSVYVDSAGNVYAGGFGASPTDPNYATDCVLFKCDSSGSLLWRAGYVHPGDDAGWAIAADPEGNIYLVTTGYTGEDTGDIITIKFRNAEF